MNPKTQQIIIGNHGTIHSKLLLYLQIIHQIIFCLPKPASENNITISQNNMELHKITKYHLILFAMTENHAIFYLMVFGADNLLQYFLTPKLISLKNCANSKTTHILPRNDESSGKFSSNSYEV